MSGPRPSRKRPSAVHRRAGHARPLRHCYNKKRLFAIALLGAVLTAPKAVPGNRIFGMRHGGVKTPPYDANGKQAFSCSQNKTRGPLCLGAARNVLM